MEQDPVETEREKELRQRVLAQYRGMQVPEMTNFQYGHFATGGIRATATQQAYADAGFQNFSQAMGGGMRTVKVDWLMLFTGVALVYVTGKLMFQQFTMGMSDVQLPLWTASLELQAKYILFTVQFDSHTRDYLQKEFQAVREANPFADFFEWLRVQRPEYGNGRRSTFENSMTAVMVQLRSNDRSTLFPFYGAVRQAMMRRGGDAQDRIDTFLDNVQQGGGWRGGGPWGMRQNGPISRRDGSPPGSGAFGTLSPGGYPPPGPTGSPTPGTGFSPIVGDGPHSSTPFPEAKV